MRALILSKENQRQQQFSKSRYEPPYDTQLDVGDLNATENFHYSVFDYDVAIVHITKSPHHSIGYFENLPKLRRDAQLALHNGRSIICLPESLNFHAERGNNAGDRVYDWLSQLGINLQDNSGVDINASGAGQAQVIQQYLKYAPNYFQIVTNSQIPTARRLAVIDNTDIVVGVEHQVGTGTLVILPPPLLDSDTYIIAMASLMDVARRYYERAQRQIPLGDAPDWLRPYLVPRAIELDDQIKKLSDEKEGLDKLAYVLYGSGEVLEDCVASLLEHLGLIVARQPSGANIDLKAIHPSLNRGFAVEVTGTKGTIQKDSSKTPQAWQYLHERTGTPYEQDKLVIVANTECHLKPGDRKHEAFSQEVIKLLGDNGVLLITTIELYDLWKSVHESRRPEEDIIKQLHSSSGRYKP